MTKREAELVWGEVFRIKAQLAKMMEVVDGLIVRLHKLEEEQHVVEAPGVGTFGRDKPTGPASG